MSHLLTSLIIASLLLSSCAFHDERRHDRDYPRNSYPYENYPRNSYPYENRRYDNRTYDSRAERHEVNKPRPPQVKPYQNSREKRHYESSQNPPYSHSTPRDYNHYDSRYERSEINKPAPSRNDARYPYSSSQDSGYSHDSRSQRHEVSQPRVSQPRVSPPPRESRNTQRSESRQDTTPNNSSSGDSRGER